MLVTTQEFYKEVVGRKTAINTPTALAALKRWNVPFFTNSPEGSLKKYWKVDTQHLPAAKAAHEAELEARRLRLEKKKAPKATNEPLAHDLAQRMMFVEQELHALTEQLKRFLDVDGAISTK